MWSGGEKDRKVFQSVTVIKATTHLGRLIKSEELRGMSPYFGCPLKLPNEVVSADFKMAFPAGLLLSTLTQGGISELKNDGGTERKGGKNKRKGRGAREREEEEGGNEKGKEEGTGDSNLKLHTVKDGRCSVCCECFCLWFK